MNQNQVDLFYIKEAYKEAMKSPDLSTQNGAILVSDNSFFSLDNILVREFNRLPEGIKINSERLSRPLKYDYTEHAERNVIYAAAREGIKTLDKILYVPWFACSDCGRAIIQAGIKEVIGYTGLERWSRETGDTKAMDWTKSIEIALEMFDEAGIKYRWVDGEIRGIEVRFAGRVVRP